MKEEKRMLEMLNKMWIGATCRLHNFVEDFKHEEKGAAEIVAIILVIVGIFTPYYGVGIRCMA